MASYIGLSPALVAIRTDAEAARDTAVTAASGQYNKINRSTAVSGNITLTDSIIFASGTITLTMPTAVGIGGRTFTVKNTGVGMITLQGTNSQTIDGYTTMTLSEPNTAIDIISNGSNWYIS
jgi:hypothetical protein